MKQIFIDVETTGLNPEKSGLTQVAGAIVIDGKVEESFNYFIKPPKGKLCDKKALEVTGMTREKINVFLPFVQQYDTFHRMLLRFVEKYDKTDKFHFLAYNSPFDSQFIRQWFLDQGDKYYGSMFWTPDICVMRMAMEYIGDDRDLFKNFKLETVCNELGIKPKGKLHDALVDIELTMALYNHIKKEE